MTTVVAIAVLALLVSFTCSLFEAALYAITPTEVEILRQRKGPAAKRIAKIRASIDEPIAAILTINTISHTLGSAVCGALVGQIYDDTAVGVFAAVFTLAVLLVSEIIPKSIGVRYALPLAPKIAWPLQLMIWTSWPVARSARWVMDLLAPSDGTHAPTPDEILMMSRLARRGGALRAQELRWVENALKLDTVTAHDLMTPRTVVDAMAADTPIAELKEARSPWVHTRLPVTEGNDPDKIVGLIHSKDVFSALVGGKQTGHLRDLMRPIDFVPETMRGDHLLDKFIAEKQHLVAVVDEYGGFEGIVTLEDVLECLLGSEIVDEHDRHADMQHAARKMAKERSQEQSSDDTERP